MNIAEIEINLSSLGEQRPFDPARLPLRLLEIYGAPRSTVARLQAGSLNKGERSDDLLWKGKLFFRVSSRDRVAETLDEMAEAAAAKAHKPRILIATDGAKVSIRDMKADEYRHDDLAKLGDHFDILLPLGGVERYEAAPENPADIKAASRLARFYDAIVAANREWLKQDRTHAMNLFMTRVLFCLFAEDTGILEEGLFSRTIAELMSRDGSNARLILTALFDAMDRPNEDREDVPAYARRYPYVNGGLFRDRTEVPEFDSAALRLLVELSLLNYAAITPDIFGSMIQAAVDPALRARMGVHYTSVSNIMNILRPMFLDSLERDLTKGWNSKPALEALLKRLYRLRVFDPACGSGNFLIVSYREMRRLEIRVFQRLKELSSQLSLPMSEIRLSSFYGIEYTDFAAETAKLSLWIAQHQLNKEFEGVFGSGKPALPLADGGNIRCGNATRVPWLSVCPAENGSETYVVGNPPYLGRGQQTAEQKADMAHVFEGVTAKYGNMDYVCAFMIKASEYAAATGGRFAFVTTNSICQGEHASLLWPLIYKRGQEILFAHQAFKWRNGASNVAGVTCIIVGVGAASSEDKLLYSPEGTLKAVKNINPYLVDAPTVIVRPRRASGSDLPRMNFGSMSNDGGHLLFSPQEMNAVLAEHPEARPLFKRIYGAQEFIKGIERWCLWLDNKNVSQAEAIPALKTRLERCRAYREDSKRPETKSWAASPHLFIENRHEAGEILFIPQVSSERRAYLPVGYLPQDSLVIAPHFAIFDAPHHVMAILSSRLHALWSLAVGGGLELRIRYSNTLIYHTLPLPDLSEKQKATLADCAWKIMDERENHPGARIDDLYDPGKMPAGLLKAHQELDEALETIYRGRPFKTDEERLSHLFKLYAARNTTETASGRAA